MSGPLYLESDSEEESDLPYLLARARARRSFARGVVSERRVRLESLKQALAEAREGVSRAKREERAAAAEVAGLERRIAGVEPSRPSEGGKERDAKAAEERAEQSVGKEEAADLSVEESSGVDGGGGTSCGEESAGEEGEGNEVEAMEARAIRKRMHKLDGRGRMVEVEEGEEGGRREVKAHVGRVGQHGGSGGGKGGRGERRQEAAGRREEGGKKARREERGGRREEGVSERASEGGRAEGEEGGWGRSEGDEGQSISMLDEVCCSFCGDAGREEVLLLCETELCPNSAHIFCLTPPLDAVPEGAWYCGECSAQRRKWLGLRVVVSWNDDRDRFAGVVDGVRWEEGKYTCHVSYDAGDDYWHDMSVVQWKLEAEEDGWRSDDSEVGMKLKRKRRRKEPRSNSPTPPSHRLSANEEQPRAASVANISDTAISSLANALQHNGEAGRRPRDALLSTSPPDTEPVAENNADSSSARPLARLAQEIAKSIDKELQARSGGQRKEYSSKVRSLVTNLKGNAELRRQVLRGEVTPAFLASASSTELATREKQMQRKEWQKRSFASKYLEEETRYVSVSGLGMVTVEDLPAAMGR